MNLTELINALEKTQQELTYYNEQLAKYNHNADTDGGKIRLEYVEKIREALNTIEHLTIMIKNY